MAEEGVAEYFTSRKLSLLVETLKILKQKKICILHGGRLK
jgi:hypothetical protein